MVAQRILFLGATSSVAVCLARLYSKDGSQFYFIARNANKLTNLCQEMGKSVLGSEAVDFSTLELNAPAIRRAYAAAGPFDLVVIAHGDLGDQARSEVQLSEALRQITVNYTSVVAQLIALTQEFERSEAACGHLVVLSSVAGVRGRPRNYTYGSAKGALTLYLQGLRSRLHGRGIVTTVKLGPVDSPMTVEHEKNALFISSERAAQLIRRAIEKKRSEIFIPARWSLIMPVVRWMPEIIFQRISALSGR